MCVCLGCKKIMDLRLPRIPWFPPCAVILSHYRDFNMSVIVAEHNVPIQIRRSWVGGQNIYTRCPGRQGMGNWAYWEALAYSLGQRWLQIGLATGGVIHGSVGRQHVFFDQVAGLCGVGEILIKLWIYCPAAWAEWLVSIYVNFSMRRPAVVLQNKNKYLIG